MLHAGYIDSVKYVCSHQSSVSSQSVQKWTLKANYHFVVLSLYFSFIKRQTREMTWKFTVNHKSNMEDSVKCPFKVSGSSVIVSTLPRIAGMSRSVRSSSHVCIILINERVSGRCTEGRNASTSDRIGHMTASSLASGFCAPTQLVGGETWLCRSFLALSFGQILYFSLTLS